MPTNTGAVSNAIANVEGYGPPGVPTNANNPGDLRLGSINNWGTAGKENQTIYPDIQTGLAALNNQVNIIANGTSPAYNGRA